MTVPDPGPGARSPVAFLITCLLASLLAFPALAGTVCGHITDADTGLPVAGGGPSVGIYSTGAGGVADITSVTFVPGSGGPGGAGGGGPAVGQAGPTGTTGNVWP